MNRSKYVDISYNTILGIATLTKDGETDVNTKAAVK